MPPKRKASAVTKKKKSAPILVERERFGFRSISFRMHMVIAVCAISALLTLGFMDRETFTTLISDAQKLAAPPPPPVTIALELHEPSPLGFLFARTQRQGGLVSVWNGSKQTAAISLPQQWVRKEVTGAPIALLRADPPALGYIRYYFPAASSITFIAPSIPQSLRLLNINRHAASIGIRTIDLASSDVRKATVLVREETVVRMWQEEIDN